MRSVLESSATFEEAIRRARDDLVDERFIDELGSLLFDSMLMADSLGRSQLVEKDRLYSHEQKRASAKLVAGKYVISGNSLSWYAGQDPSLRISFDLIPREAVEFLRRRAFWISGMKNQEILDAIQGRLEAALKEGRSYRDFQREVSPLLDTLGLSGPEPARMQTVFRTNIFSAYTVGQMEQVVGMHDRFPLWRYVAIKDDRTRPSHRALDGQVFRVGEGPIPPIDFNCRCTMQFLHQFEVEREQPPIVEDPEALLRKLQAQFGGGEIQQFDIKREFEEWLRRKMEGLDKRIVHAVSERLK